MDKTITINFRDIVSKSFPAGTTLLEISKSFQKYFNYPVLVARVDNEMADLSEKVNHNCSVDFYDRSSSIGNSVYSRSLYFMLVLAVKRVLGSNTDVIVEHSIDKGVYCEIIGADVDKPIISKIENQMLQIVQEGYLFTKVNVSRYDTIKYFKKLNRMDKVKALKYISNSYITLYRLDDLYDYLYSEMVYSTRELDEFKLTYIRDNGFVLSYPDIYNPECTLDYVHHKKMYDTFLDYTKWGRILEIDNAADLNELVSTGKYDNLIRLSEAYYNSQLSRIADDIYKYKNDIKIVLIAGPSSSGKTISAKKLEIYLQSHGLKTHQISLDDYFHNRDDTPKDENGDYDFESIRAIDIELFNQHLSKLLNKERVLLPEFNFVNGTREYKNKWLQLGDNDILVIEGLHGLNEELTQSIEKKHKYKIYISTLTQLNIDIHNRVHTTDTRKLRRIVRDNKYRGYNAADTLKMWPSIRDGEEKYIFQYQDEADIIVNSALVYELGVLKTYAEPLLFSVDENDEVYPEALRLINFLRGFLPVPSDNVPNDSILREFIGGSCFNE
ncbi:MAG TPA: nucleoside kinase [Mollicutes bacterium]|nr:nucleoside kinase [Mollicutes bacterium]